MSINASLNEKQLDSWNANTAYWDDHIGRDGNKYWKVLQRPTLKRLVHIRSDSRALDLATGNGLVARWLVAEGVKFVLATDGSENMLERAVSHGKNNCGEPEVGWERIEYRRLDVTQPKDFETLLADPQAIDGFDIIVMNMAIMDVATLQPLADALPKLLKEDGVFVATMLHPVFWTSGAARNIEVKDDPVSGELQVIRTKIIRDYLYVPPASGVSVPGQPAYQLYFHRPLHELFSTFFKAGLVMDALEEPAFTEDDRIQARVEAHSNYTQIPALLAFRLRRAK